jgi:hypothetical protein
LLFLRHQINILERQTKRPHISRLENCRSRSLPTSSNNGQIVRVNNWLSPS